MKLRAVLGLVICLGASASLASNPERPQVGAPPSTLTIEDRIAAQHAIERVYWSHRIWPKENPTPKPPLAVVMSDEAIRAKVEDYLKKSTALEHWWHRPITAEQLQAELDRMARGSRDPEMLRELFAALGNNATLIAETLARRSLADRLIRDWYAYDDRFHGELRRIAESARARTRTVAEMRSMGGEYREITYRRRSQTPSDPNPTILELDSEEWDGTLHWLARRFGATADTMPLDRLTDVAEDHDRFSVAAVLSRRDDETTIAIVGWPKRSFDSWWEQERAASSSEISTVAAAYSVAAPSFAGCASDTWEGRFSVPTLRSSHSAVWTGTEMIVWGGWDGSAIADGGRYNPAIDEWSAISAGPNAPSARQAPTVVWTGTEMIIWGGMDLNTGGAYDPVLDSWRTTSTGANVPSARWGHSAVWTGTEMIVWGGAGLLNTGGAYDPELDSWRATSTGTGVPSGRAQHSAVWTGSEMIIWGGGDSASQNTGGRYDPLDDSWTATSVGVDVPSARTSHTAVWTGAEMIVWGGYFGTFLASGGSYNPSTDSWTPTSTGTNSPSARDDHTAVWTGTEMIVWGGMDGSVSYLNTGGRYVPSTDTWTATSTGANVPSARRGHSAVWTGTELIVWAGYNGSTLDTGGRYDPTTNIWTVTSTGHGAPSNRFGHTALWTGTEMIIWGGFDGNAYTNSGGRYDRALDAWTPTPIGANLPSVRGHHTAVWTGTEMIVWGGTGVSRLNTGGRYNPNADTWNSTQLSSAPSARHSHTAVWTGTEMIVWGGSGSNSTPLNTGGRYNPSGGIWSATATTAPVPSPRVGHTAVWTGLEMIVWGGLNGSTSLDSGGRYSASANAWTVTSTDSGVPSGRYGHTAVWTGSEMIVWGGQTDSAWFNSGARYSPSANLWSATSLGQSAPSERSAHSAVWTGRELIVWGGLIGRFEEERSLGTGARYDSAADAWSATSDLGAPTPRYGHTAIWTGTEMIISGGYRGDSGSHRYCAAFCAGPPVGSASLFISRPVAGSGEATLVWIPVAAAAGYDVVRGSLSQLRATGGDFSTSTTSCLANDLPATAISDSSDEDAWYLVRAVGCGGIGSFDSGHPTQVQPRDVEIQASGQACP